MLTIKLGAIQAIRILLATILLSTISNITIAQVGPVIWEENFNNLDNWIKEVGNGSWGWGNGELEFYQESNVSIAPVPGEPGNNALRINAKQESGPGIVDQWGNPLNYTSGRLNTKSKVSVQYGVIETRVRVPDIDLGGWPAVWLLGLSNLSWPQKGEIDMMEMGQRKVARDLHDAHNGGNNMDNSTVNQTVGSNAIFYSDAAVNPQNPSGAASISYDPADVYARPYYNYSSPLNDRFLIYRLYWDQDSLRFTVIDNGTEYDLFEDPFPIDSASFEFREPFYFVANLAIGGAFTDAYNLGDPGSGAPVSMSFPADMYVDYIKVMEWNGQGEVNVGPPEFQSGNFGIFTDNTPTTAGITPGLDAEIFVWEGTLADATIPPYEGSNGISWTTTGKGWFGAGILSLQPVNLFDFAAGNLKFRIKIPANVSFKIGIVDAWGNENYVDFPANTTAYGLVRDGNWGQACIPVSDIRGTLIDLRMLSYEFTILEINGTACTFAIDDIYWEDGIDHGLDSISTTNISYTSATLNWNTDPSAVGYVISGGEPGGGQVNLSVGQVNSYNATGLKAGKTYYWTIAADRDTMGLVPSMLYDTFSTVSCNPPSGLNAFDISSNAAKLNWNTADNASKYKIYGAQQGSSSIVSININNPSTSVYTASGLSPSTTYNWAMTSSCPGYGTSKLSSIGFFTTNSGPAAKSGLEVDEQIRILQTKSAINLIAVSDDKIEIVILYNLEGKMIEQIEISQPQYRMNTESLADGIYMITIQTEESRIQRMIFIH
ncbi:MAG: family 16 glycosylhydrolase [Chitinophagales bacterium]|nr:family 16 glycosylhydrolase [Chitinophagales bacterium]